MIVRAIRRFFLFVLAGLAPGLAHAECSMQTFAELPVTMSGMRPLIAATINGHEGSFIADSGAFYSLISPGMAGATGLRVTAAPLSYRIGGIGGSTSAYYTTVQDLVLGGNPIHKIDFFVAGSDTGTAGLIGQNILGIADVEYDLPHGIIRLTRSKDCGHALLAYWATDGAYSSIPIEERNAAHPHTIGTVIVNGVAIKAIFDTGASRTILSLRAAARAGVKPGDPGVVRDGATSGLGRKVGNAWRASFASFKIGDEEIHNPRLRIGEIDLSDADMLVGADFFISHRVYVGNAVHKMFFSYTGGNIFDQNARSAEAEGPPPAAAGPAPADAEGYSRRGAVFATQRDLARAIADFGKAIELAPREPRYRVERARAYLRDGKPGAAMADLDSALAADPANVAGRIERARLHLRQRERAAALDDLEAAAGAITGPAQERFEIAGLYEELDAPDREIAQYDLWIPAHREDSRLPQALDGRCRARAFTGQDLDRALADCNSALRASPHTAPYLVSRGLVRLRMGDLDRAISDFDEALKIAPKAPWALYGRGVARQHKGLAADARADFDAVAAVAPNLPARAKRFGIS
jgi:tetratricopeptide (TPR) repeat protein